MKSPILYSLLFLLGISWNTSAQDPAALENYIIEVENLEEEAFVKLVQSKLKNSQFAMVGEQHSIQEAAIFTDAIYRLGQDHGYQYLCIETDALAAKMITDMEGSVEKARAFYADFPIALPFYNNENDHFLFKTVLDSGGEIWGIDQTFMAQFRPNLAHLVKTTKNKAFKTRLEEVLKQANASYQEFMESKNFQAAFLFKYSEDTHEGLMKLAKTEEEKEVLFQLWKTKEIYNYYFIQKQYQNNNVRGQLMKSNFMRYYRQAPAKPKVVFKLGANHAAKGLTRTNIYDISNLVSELAISNGMHSVHFFLMGISGQQTLGNPFAADPVSDFDNTEMFPKEIQELIPNYSKKYMIVDTEPLRDFAYGDGFSEELKSFIFKYDVLVLVRDARAVKNF